MVCVDHAALGIGAHAAAADEMGVAVDHEHVLSLGRVEDVVQRLCGVGDVLAVVLALRVVHPGDGETVAVLDLGGHGDAVLR